MKTSTSLLAFLAVLFLTTTSLSAQGAYTSSTVDCPPTGDPTRTTTTFDAQGNELGTTTAPVPFSGGTDVNGDGKKDVLGKTLTDANGHKIECWCMQKSSKISQRFAYAFISSGTTDRGWFGGCFFPNGRNSFSCTGGAIASGPKKGQIPWDSCTQHNISYGPDGNGPPTGTADKHFVMHITGACSGKIQKFKTEGVWHQVGTSSKPEYKYETTKKTACPKRDPAENPEDLTAYALNVSEPPGHTGVGVGLGNRALSAGPTIPIAAAYPGVHVPRLIVIPDPGGAPFFDYRLIIAPLNPGPTSDPNDIALMASDVSIHTGDRFVVTGDGIVNAFVDPSAAVPSAGGWRVAEIDSEHATFEATADASPYPGTRIGPFTIESPFSAGDTQVAYTGVDIGQSNLSIGPVATAATASTTVSLALKSER